MHHLKRLSTRTRQFQQFRTRLPGVDWSGGKILDFGGNRGGFLRGAGDAVRPRDYWCIDPCRPALEDGRKRFPEAHFLHYDRHSPGYHPAGRLDARLPEPGVEFDVVVAFSVFTHVHTADMLDLVARLRAWLRPGGVLAFTFFDPHYDPRDDPGYDLELLGEEAGYGSNLEERMLKLLTLDPRLPMAEWLEQARGARWCTIVSDRMLVEPNEELSRRAQVRHAHPTYITYYRADYMKELFPDAEILPPLSPERQHFCVLGSPAPPGRAPGE